MGIIRVSEVQGYIIKRPAKDHPNPEHWSAVREERRAVQTLDGAVHCGTCPEQEGGSYGLDLHHRHYNTFGKERVGDVILLCRPCHDAITSRLRAWRYEEGDMSVEAPFVEADNSRYVPPKRDVIVEPVVTVEPQRSPFRPAPRKINLEK